jgi:hypothetical protein
MKKLLLILLCLPMIGFGQNVYIPDANFKSYLVGNSFINTNGDSEIQVSEATAFNGQLNCGSMNISDLTGIEAFTSLTNLDCQSNSLTTLDVSQNTALELLVCVQNQLTSLDINQNTALTDLFCGSNQLTSLDVSQNTALEFMSCGANQLISLNVNGAAALTQLSCGVNQLTSLDVSTNTSLTSFSCNSNQLTSLNINGATALTNLDCSFNQLTSLDVSTNTALDEIHCYNNQLQSLDVSNNTNLLRLYCNYNQLTTLDFRNGNNTYVLNWGQFWCTNNPNLTCINVDDATLSTANWTVANGSIDPQHYFSNNCSGTSVEEHTTNKEILKVTDLLGRETKQKNKPLFYIYDDGTVEKRIVIE